MNLTSQSAGFANRRAAKTLAAMLLGAAFLANTASAAPRAARHPVARPAVGGQLAPCSATTEAAPVAVTLGKYRLVNLSMPIARLVRGDTGSGYTGIPTDGAAKDAARAGLPPAPTGEAKTGVGDADVMLLSPTQLYVLGKRVGALNLITQDRSDRCTVMDVVVTMDAGSLQAKLGQVMPEERTIKVNAAEDSLILSGEVADAVKVQRAMTVAAAYAPEKRIVNLLRATAASQVMLEVKVAEVSKTLLDKLGARAEATSGGSGWQYSLSSQFLTDGAGLLEAFKSGKGRWQINGEKDDGVVRVLAEPNLMAISGQQASFLSGGKIFIPVAQTNNGGFGASTITLEEKEFGVGLKFIPTVLEGDRINLKVTSEVSELSQTGSPFTTLGGVTAVLPSMTTRRADTSVQLRDGQSFAIAGLIKNNLSESIKRFPGLGDIPLLGALFRSAEFQRDMTELLFIITPRLVKPLPANYAVPTDNFKEPTRSEFLIGGKLEGGREAKPQKPAPVSDAGAAGTGAPRGDMAPAPAAEKAPALPAGKSAARPDEKAAVPAPMRVALPPVPSEPAAAATPTPVVSDPPTPLAPAKDAAAAPLPALVSRGEPG
ncbi:MAG: type II and III secretion system protein family protein [Ignavibacteria bacterium]